MGLNGGPIFIRMDIVTQNVLEIVMARLINREQLMTFTFLIRRFEIFSANYVLHPFYKFMTPALGVSLVFFVYKTYFLQSIYCYINLLLFV